jgi:KaiC/GvpD/RAD55 family RecA-like ATPase
LYLDLQSESNHLFLHLVFWSYLCNRQREFKRELEYGAEVLVNISTSSIFPLPGTPNFNMRFINNY